MMIKLYAFKIMDKKKTNSKQNEKLAMNHSIENQTGIAFIT